MGCFALGVALVLPLLTPARVDAESPPASEATTVDVLLAEADAAMTAGRLEDALLALRAAWRIKPAPEIACNIGFLARRAGHAREAAEHLTLCVQNPPPSTTANDTARRAAESAELALALQRVAVLSIHVTPPGAEVYIDGRSLGVAPLKDRVLVEPGAHPITAEIDGRIAAASITVAEGAERAVTLLIPERALPSSGAPIAPRPTAALAAAVPAPPGPSRPARIAAAILATTAGGAVVSGLAFLLAGSAVRSRAEDTLKAQVAGGTGCSTRGSSEIGPCGSVANDLFTSEVMSKVAIWSFIGAGAAGAAASILAFYPSGSKAGVSVGARGLLVVGSW